MPEVFNKRKKVDSDFEISFNELVRSVSPDGKKILKINEEFTNQTYIQTSGILEWNLTGGGILYYSGRSIRITADWIDNHTLEIIHEPNLIFTKKEFEYYLLGETVRIINKSEQNALQQRI